MTLALAARAYADSVNRSRGNLSDEEKRKVFANWRQNMRKVQKRGRPLQPPRNFRRVNRACCAMCKYWQLLDGWYACQRAPATIGGCWNECEPEYHVCDGFVRLDK